MRAERPQGAAAGPRRLLRTLAALAALHALGLALFARGFLLTRVELPGVSGCGDAAQLSPRRAAGAAPDAPPGCWLDARVSKAVVLLIDGLRWDIAAGDAGSAVAGRNLSLPSLAALAAAHGPRAAALLPFVADPPTTTQQRLKGLLTGGLPTFVDVGDSFGAPALREDNLVAALARSGRRVALLGDDTWRQLFPEGDAGGLAFAHPFPSFNVADLHTVDTGVTRHLRPLLADHGSWDVLVAHYLGVDHAGHTHGVDSAAMAAKLAELDAAVRDTAAALAADATHARTLLLVMGDHGMTWAGDHGGGSEEETRSAIFALRPHAPRAPAAAAAAADTAEPMPQVDFAPTMALLLGAPVPFGSVGRVSAALWAAAGGGDARGSLAAARRVNAWQVARAIDAYAARGSFAAADVDALRRLYAAAAADGGDTDAFLLAAATLAREQWTSFRGAPMAAGLLLLAAALVAHVAILRAALPPASSAGDDEWAPMAAAVGAIAAAHTAGVFSVGYMQREQAALHAPMAACAAAHVALAAWRCARARRLCRRRLRDACALLAVTGGVAAAAMHGEDKPSEALDAATLALAVLPLLALSRLLPRAVPRGWRAGAVEALVWAAFLAVGAHWAAADALAAGWPLPRGAAHAARIVLPRAVYVAGAAAVVASAAGWLGGDGDAVAAATAAAARGALAALAPPLLLLTGRRAPLLALLAAAQAALLLCCHAPRRARDAAPAGAAVSPAAAAALSRCGACSLAAGAHFSALQLFAASGHRSAFDALHFKAAFTGFEAFNFWRQGALLAANTWSAELAHAAAAPLLAAAASAGGAADAAGFWRALTALLAARGLLHALGATAAAVAAAALRRHLHVWSLFAPKFVFEAARLLLADALAAATVLLAAAAAACTRRAKAHAA